MTVGFGDVVQTTFIDPSEKKFGNSTISYSGAPTVYRPGDVVNIPYGSGEISTIQALGAAWAAYTSGIGPSGI
jgi:hypothetical protein